MLFFVFFSFLLLFWDGKGLNIAAIFKKNMYTAEKKEKRNNRNYFSVGIITLAVGTFGLLGYGKIWEYRQPKQQISNAVVTEVKPYCIHGEIWPSTGTYVYVAGQEKPIDFISKNLGAKLKKGDTADIVVRKKHSIFGSGLEGLSYSKL